MDSSLKIVADSGELAFDDKRLRLTPVNLKVLLCLLDKKGEVATRSDLFDTVWPNQTLSDDVLTKAISDLRTQLKKLCGQAPITTIPKVGYRWQREVIDASLVSTIEPQTDELDNSDTQDLQVYSKFALINKSLPWLISFVLSVILLVTAWSYWIQPSALRVAVLPVSYSDARADTLAINIELQIKAFILNSERTRYLSSKAISSIGSGQFNRFSRELGVVWIIESELLLHQDQWRFTLYLVDAKTGLVADVKQIDNLQRVEQIEPIAKMMLSDIEQ